MATLLGILVAGYSVVYTVNANNDTEQARQAAATAAQREDRAASFELAAAQIVMSQRSCALAAARAKELIRLFPAQLKTPLFRRFTKPSEPICKALKRTQPASTSTGLGGLEFLFPGLFP